MTKKVTLYIVDKQDGSIKPFVFRRTTSLDTNSDWVFFADKDVANAYLVNHINAERKNYE